MTYDAIDEFAGPGGWDEGARAIGLRTLGLDLDENACRTAKAAGHDRIRADVATYPASPFAGVAGYIASPPCPDFSTAGKGAGETGKSGRLVRHPLRRVLELRPEWTAWEQVRPVQPIWRSAAYQLRQEGYSVWTGVVNAADFGVPQERLRAVLLASRVRTVGPPTPTHAHDSSNQLLPLREHVTLADVLGLPAGWFYDSGQNSVMAGGRGHREATVSRYGAATADPLGRDGTGWALDDKSRLPVWQGEGPPIRRPRCESCFEPLHLALYAAGVRLHPTCGPSELSLLVNRGGRP